MSSFFGLVTTGVFFFPFLWNTPLPFKKSINNPAQQPNSYTEVVKISIEWRRTVSSSYLSNDLHSSRVSSFWFTRCQASFSFLIFYVIISKSRHSKDYRYCMCRLNHRFWRNMEAAFFFFLVRQAGASLHGSLDLLLPSKFLAR